MGCEGSTLSANDPKRPPILKQIIFNNPRYPQGEGSNAEELTPRDILQLLNESQSVNTSNNNSTFNNLRTNSLTHTHETILTEVDRRSINSKSSQFPFDCIGVLHYLTSKPPKTTTIQGQLQGIKIFEGIGNGFLISKSIVLTAGHNIDFYQENEGKELKFLPNNLTSDGMKYNSIGVKGYRRIKQSQSVNFGQDFALIELKEQIQKQRYIALGFDYCLQDTQAQIAAFRKSSDNNHFQQTWMKGKIKSIRQKQIFYDIDTQGGQSGAPIFVQLGKENYFAIGIHVGKDLNPYNNACKITGKMVNRLKQWCAEFESQNKIAAVKMPSLFAQALPRFIQTASICLTQYQQKDIFVKQQQKNIKIQAEKIQGGHSLKTIGEQKDENEESQSNKMQNPESQKQLQIQQNKCKQYEAFVNDNTLEQLFNIAKYQFHHQMYQKSLLLCQTISKKIQHMPKNKQRAVLQNLIALNYHNLDQSDIAISILSNVILENMQSRNFQIMALTYNNIGAIYFDIGKNNQALKLIKEALRLHSQHHMQRESYKISLLYNFGVLNFSKDEEKANQAISKMDQAIKGYQDSSYRSRKELSEMYDSLSHIHYTRGNYALWLKNAFTGICLLKDYYQQKLRLQQKRQKQKKKIDNLASKYPHYHERQNIFIEEFISLAKGNSLSLDLFLQGLMIIDQILIRNQNIRIRSILIEGVKIFKNKLYQTNLIV